MDGERNIVWGLVILLSIGMACITAVVIVAPDRVGTLAGILGGMLLPTITLMGGLLKVADNGKKVDSLTALLDQQKEVNP